MALIMLMVLSALMVAFAVMSSSEPGIASNHVNTNQVLYLADSGVGNALWALSNPTAPNAIPSLVTIAARYNSPLPPTSAWSR
jgi:hypothetical protein